MTFSNPFPLFSGQLDCSEVWLRPKMASVGICPGNGPETENIFIKKLVVLLIPRTMLMKPQTFMCNFSDHTHSIIQM